MKIREVAAGTDPKHGAATQSATRVPPASVSRPVKIAVAALHEIGLWFIAIVGGTYKGVKIRVVAAWSDLKYGAAAARPARRGRSVEIAVAAVY